jgi:hypothetical protein
MRQTFVRGLGDGLASGPAVVGSCAVRGVQAKDFDPMQLSAT